jgi:uncharacterized protein (DUF2147 family)
MKKFFVGALHATSVLPVMLLTTLCLPANAADRAEGYWLGVDEKNGEVMAGWEVYQQDGFLLGKLLSARGITGTETASGCKDRYPGFPLSGKVSAMPVLGTPWIFGLRREAPGRWIDGSVIVPIDGNLFKCTLTHHPADGKAFPVETLELRGQVFVFSRSQYWRRATLEEAAGLR